MNRVVFYLMNKKGLYVLKEFLNKFEADNIEYIVLSEDKNLEKDYYNELVNICDEYSIKYFHRNDKIPDFSGYKFSIGWRWLIKDISNLIVFHDSILPKYRGFSPLVNMLINGETEIGVTAFFASSEYDKGNIINYKKINISYPIKIGNAIEAISSLYSKLVNEIYDLIKNNIKILDKVQNENEATYSLWRDEDDYYINWRDDAKKIQRMIDAVGFPYAGARTFLNNKLIIIEEVEKHIDLYIENRDVGKVLFLSEGYPVVVCGQGLLKVKKAKYLDGRSIMPFRQIRSRFGGGLHDTF